MSTPEWVAEFERDEAKRMERVETAKAAAEEHRKRHAELIGIVRDQSATW